MSDTSPMSFALPRPGPALKAVLITAGVTGLLSATLMAWVPAGVALARALVCTTPAIQHWQLWRLVTSGLVMMPGEGAITHLLMILVALFFLSPDLERRWGAARFVRFIVASVVLGNLVAVAVDKVAAPSIEIFHPQAMWGAGAAIAATAIAWALENAEMQVRLFF